MQVNVAGVRRNLKNLAHNYTEPQKKVREATSNDPWGPSCTLMSEIADLTYNVMAFTEIMQMIWKRLNDHGKNWRHVYKALTLLEYLIKTGSERVAQQCKENIYAIQTLKDFQYYDEGKDQGLNVREKAKHLVNLLKDEEKMKNERAKALKARERLAQNVSALGSDGTVDTVTLSAPTSPTGRVGTWNANGVAGRSTNHHTETTSREIESARPQTVGEEELQLQLALAMSREEAELEEQRRKSDDVRLQLALSESQNELKKISSPISSKPSHLLDLLDVNLATTESADPWSVAAPSTSSVDPWGMPLAGNTGTTTSTAATAPAAPAAAAPAAAAVAVAAAASAPSDPWAPVAAKSEDPWMPQTIKKDPWSPVGKEASPVDEFEVIGKRSLGTTSPNAFNLSALDSELPENGGRQIKSAHEFLGENSGLVNLDNLVTKPTTNLGSLANPFAPQQPTNLFQQPAPPRPTINEIRQAPIFGDNQTLPSPLTPSPNPFLS